MTSNVKVSTIQCQNGHFNVTNLVAVQDLSAGQNDSFNCMCQMSTLDSCHFDILEMDFVDIFFTVDIEGGWRKLYTDKNGTSLRSSNCQF